jgi:hypothetical protein
MPPLAVQASWPTPQNYAKGDEKNHEPGLTPLDLAVRPEMPAAIQERRRKGQKPWPTDSDCGTPESWPTPRSEDSEQTGAHAGVADTLTSKARLDWPTPEGMAGGKTSRGGARKDELLLTGMVQAHRCAGPPAPARSSTSGKRRDWRTPEAMERGVHPCPDAKAGQHSLVTQAKGQLNPAWVTQLQGLPDGWLDLPDDTLLKLWGTRIRRTSRTSSDTG